VGDAVEKSKLLFNTFLKKQAPLSTTASADAVLCHTLQNYAAAGLTFN
jgi:hypothetical protein